MSFDAYSSAVRYGELCNSSLLETLTKVYQTALRINIGHRADATHSGFRLQTSYEKLKPSMCAKRP